MNVLGVGAPAPTSLSSSALHFRLKVTNILPPSPIYHSRTVFCAISITAHHPWSAAHTWARGGARNPLQTSSPPLSPGRRGGATAQSALGWYRPSVGVPETLDGRPSGVLV